MYELYPSLSLLKTKKTFFKCERNCCPDAIEGLCLPKTNTKKLTKNIEMNQIVTNSEINLHNCLCVSRGFKTGRSNHRRCSTKKGGRKAPASEPFFQKRVCIQKRLRHRFFPVRFGKYLRTAFFTEHFRATVFE